MKQLIIIFLIFFFTGCSVNTVKLPTSYNHHFTGKQKAKRISAINQCGFILNSYLDARESKSLGFVALTIVESDVEAWLLSALEKNNIKAQNNMANAHIDVTLVKAYIHSMQTSMAANVVIKVAFVNGKDKQKPKYYRGHEVSVNWASGEGEIAEALNKAMGNAIAKFREESKEVYCT
ncbi:hypothetical protein HII17_14300 [Thalassotalea sp. M1531]|uniref:Lipoprotein n=1 Tax=Thalassotalea algicola TaxID=2716224 RepID=A0A7Y0LDV2_9GAMM|nr:hypothetical protein [Thalassotalea algicola]NMP32730.1 hypothetical protein [Thalassotalea algicola]